MQATYDGSPEGAPAVFIAKFLNPDPSFAFFRWALGSTGTPTAWPWGGPHTHTPRSCVRDA